MSRLTIVLLIATLASDSVGQPAHGGTADMFEFIIDAIRKSQAAAIVEAIDRQRVAGGEQGYLRVTARVAEVVKGQLTRGSTFVIDIVDEGRETPNIQPGTEYLFFLRHDDGGSWRVLDLTRPVTVRPEDRDHFLENLQAAAKLASATPSTDELKRHYLAMLRTGIRFFATDAAKACSSLQPWNERELRQVIDILQGKGVAGRPQGNDYDHLVALVVHHATVPLASSFAREELKQGHGDAVYFGLLKRNDSTVDAIVGALLRDPDQVVRNEAVRVAGLLRKNQLLDEVERHLTPDEGALRQALAAARALAARD
jgi:hypothetical protein